MYFKALLRSIGEKDSLFRWQAYFQAILQIKTGSPAKRSDSKKQSQKRKDFVCTASIALHKKLVTVRQILSDDPAPQIQAFAELRRSPLSFPAAAWPCRKVLLNTAPLSRRFSFLHPNTLQGTCQYPFFISSILYIYASLYCAKSVQYGQLP